jgi:hypothetical protein
LINAHYLFFAGEKLRVCPLAGLGILGSKVNVPTIDPGSGGLDYFLEKDLVSMWDLGLELRVNTGYFEYSN